MKNAISLLIKLLLTCSSYCCFGQDIDLELETAVNAIAVNEGDTFYYTISVFNTSVYDASGIEVTCSIPATVSFDNSIATNGSFSAIESLWTINSIAGGDTAALVVTLEASIPGTVSLSAEIVAADQEDSDSSPGNYGSEPLEDDEASIDVQIIDLQGPLCDISLSLRAGVSEAEIGEPLVTKLVVHNSGPDGTPGVKVHFPYPEQFDLIESIQEAGVYNPATASWNLGDLASMQEKALTLVLYGTEAGSFSFQAQVSQSDYPDADSSPNNDDGDQSEDDEDEVTVHISSNEAENPVKILPNGSTDLQQLLPSSVTVFPNPCSDHLVLEFDSDQLVNYQLIDHLGKMSMEGSFASSKLSLDLSFLPEGTYLLRLQGSKIQHCHRVLILH